MKDPHRQLRSGEQEPDEALVPKAPPDQWIWEQDTRFRYTRITSLTPAWIDAALFQGLTRWDLPGARALSEPWSTHRGRLDRQEPFTDFEHFVFPANGHPPRYFSSSGQPRYDHNGRFIGYSGVSRDITVEVSRRLQASGTLDLLRVAAQLGKFGAWSSDLRTGVTTWSIELQGIHGCPWGSECTNDQVLELFAPDSQPVLAAAFSACASHGTPYDLELQILDGHGQRVWVRVIGVATRNGDGQITHLQGAYQDIQASKLVSESNRSWAARFRTTLDSLSDGFAIIDRQWSVTYANPAAAATLGVVLEEAIGRNYWELFPEVRGTAFGDYYQAAMDRRESRRFEDYYRPLDMWLRISVFPLEEGIAISFTDISAAMRERASLLELNAELERRVAERTAKLEALNADLKAFSYSVAHDLRSPIGRMAGFATALRHNAAATLDERGTHYLNRIEASASEMDAMTEGLITLFQVAHREIDLRQLDLAGIARECVSSLRQEDPAGASVSVVIDESMPVCADAGLMAITMENLISNAFKYSRGRPSPTVHVGSHLVNGSRQYFVKDNGAGFDMRTGQALFKPFSRLHGPEFEGAGIGLATVAKIIGLHRGRIWAESAPGHGATFSFTLGTSRAD